MYLVAEKASWFRNIDNSRQMGLVNTAEAGELCPSSLIPSENQKEGFRTLADTGSLLPSPCLSLPQHDE